MPAELLLLCVAAFSAGFVDAIVGGGGLIQTPAALVLLPQYPVAAVIGSLKIPAFTGTGFATIQYARKINIQWRTFIIVGFIAFLSAIAGSVLLQMVDNKFMKPVILIVLILVAVYTYSKKDFGTHTERTHSRIEQLVFASAIGLLLGFYDGFIGPGTGSFLIIAFISILGFDFLKASAHAKLVNLATNFGSILFFVSQGLILYEIAIPMAFCNGIGGFAGAKLAILKGNRFIRIFFLIIVAGTILRFAYDIISRW
jgi:uncharacterized membrane protein YfcA